VNLYMGHCVMSTRQKILSFFILDIVRCITNTFMKLQSHTGKNMTNGIYQTKLQIRSITHTNFCSYIYVYIRLSTSTRSNTYITMKTYFMMSRWRRGLVASTPGCGVSHPGSIPNTHVFHIREQEFNLMGLSAH
jgi:hypothetical protein